MSSTAHRADLLRQLEASRGSKVILYVTGDRPGWEAQISADAVDAFIEHLDPLVGSERISLVLYTRGGNTSAAWNLTNLIRQFCDELEVIIPFKAWSSGTLMSLGADKIVMTKQASLGPIDPSVNSPLNPQIPGAPAGARVPVSVEAIRGFLDLASQDLKIKDDQSVASIFNRLTEFIHPLVLGQIFRSRAQIQYLAKRLLTHQVHDPEKVDRIIAFLCSESGSHDYTINRREARELGLNIESPDDTLYALIKGIYASFRDEMELNTPFDPMAYISGGKPSPYQIRRCLVESLGSGCHAFVSEGVLTPVALGGPPGLMPMGPIPPGSMPPAPMPPAPMPPGPMPVQINDERNFEGWRKIA
jgi:Periplasmic serine proteases (ClpP class)